MVLSQTLPLVHIMECDRDTVQALAERTGRSVTTEELVFREAELSAVYVTAEVSGDPELDSPAFLACLWAAYDRLTRGDVVDAAAELRRAATDLPTTRRARNR